MYPPCFSFRWFMGGRPGRLILYGYFFLFAVLLVSCAARRTLCIDNALASVSTLTDVHYRLGYPKSSTRLPDGNIQYEWLLDVSYDQPGHFETEISPWVRYDSDGYRIETEREVWKRPSRVTKYCQIKVVVDASGKVLFSEYTGANCCDLVIRPSGTAGRPSM